VKEEDFSADLVLAQLGGIKVDPLKIRGSTLNPRFLPSLSDGFTYTPDDNCHDERRRQSRNSP
jgi:hypothetical protein